MFWSAQHQYARGESGRGYIIRLGPTLSLRLCLSLSYTTDRHCQIIVSTFSWQSWNPGKMLPFWSEAVRREHLISHNVWIKWLQKINSPTKSSTYCLLFSSKTRSLRLGGGVDFLKPFNDQIVWDKSAATRSSSESRIGPPYWGVPGPTPSMQLTLTESSKASPYKRVQGLLPSMKRALTESRGSSLGFHVEGHSNPWW